MLMKRRSMAYCLRHAFILLLLTSCGSGDHSHTPQEPQVEPKTAQITVWGKRYELFIEHRLPVAGTPANFITHVTDMKTLDPRSTGMITYVLCFESGDAMEHPVQTPERAGIYIPKITFPKAGKWNLSIRIPNHDGGEVVEELPALIVYATKDEADKAPEPEAPEGISFLKEQQWKILTKTDPAVKRKMVERLRMPGVVRVRPGSRALVTSPFTGALAVPSGKSLLSMGDHVEAGQVLALVLPPVAGQDLLAVQSNQIQMRVTETEFSVKGAEIEANAIKEKVALEQAQAILARIKKLYQEQAKSKRELEEAEFAVRTSQASTEAAAAMKKVYDEVKARMTTSLPQSFDIRQGYPPVELRAPISGTITEVNATVGEQISPDRPIMTILDTSTVFIEARLSEMDLGRAASTFGAYYEAPEAKGKFVPILGNNGGRLVYTGSEIDPSTRTLPLVYESKNPEGRLRIGMSLTLFVETQRAAESVAIPESAIVDDEGRSTVYVMLAGEAFEKREVTLGVRDEGFVQVLSGLKEGERIVTKGAYAVKLASVSTVIPAHGHAH